MLILVLSKYSYFKLISKYIAIWTLKIEFHSCKWNTLMCFHLDLAFDFMHPPLFIHHKFGPWKFSTPKILIYPILFIFLPFLLSFININSNTCIRKKFKKGTRFGVQLLLEDVTLVDLVWEKNLWNFKFEEVAKVPCSMKRIKRKG
jgi:hypothetical protein